MFRNYCSPSRMLQSVGDKERYYRRILTLRCETVKRSPALKKTEQLAISDRMGGIIKMARKDHTFCCFLERNWSCVKKVVRKNKWKRAIENQFDNRHCRCGKQLCTIFQFTAVTVGAYLVICVQLQNALTR